MKSKKNLLFLVILMFMSIMHIGWAQEEQCGAEPPQNYNSFMLNRLKSIVNIGNRALSAPVSLPVQHHVSRNSNGSSPSVNSTEIQNVMDELNATYASMNISFYEYSPVKYIDNSSWNSSFNKDLDNQLASYEVPQAINIFYFSGVQGSGGSICGYAKFPGTGNRVVLKVSCSQNGSTASHELGHYFSVLHTHSTTNGRELVKRTNCNNTGDFFCDTPADPNISGKVNSSCNYTGSSTDTSGDRYTPDTRNIMSYTRKSCRTGGFSNEQQNAIVVSLESDRAYLLANDKEAPSNPTGLIASNTTTNSTNLSWAPSTDNIGVTEYEIFQGTTKIKISTTTSVVVDGLSPDTGYSFTIKAKDAAGNISGSSNVVNVTTPGIILDTEAPSSPTGLVASAITETSVHLSWTASTDNTGVTEYLVLQNGISTGVSATTNFEVAGIAPDTVYSFTIKAKDAAGNISENSNAVEITTVAVIEYVLTTNSVGNGTVSGAGTYPNGTTVALTATPGTGYSFIGWGGDLNGNANPASVVVRANTSITATFAEITEQVLTENTSGGDKIEVNKGQSGAQSFRYDNSNYSISKVTVFLSRDSEEPASGLQFTIGTGVNSGAITGSDVIIPPSQIKNTSEGSNFTAYEITFASPVGPLDAGVTYYLNFENNSANGKKYYLEYTGGNAYPNGTYYKSGSNDGKDAKFQVFGKEINSNADTQPPTTPSKLEAIKVENTSVTLAWEASVDDRSAVNYEVFKEGSFIGNSSSTNFSIDGLSPNTTYSFTIRAKDIAGNMSGESNQVQVTTLGAAIVEQVLIENTSGGNKIEVTGGLDGAQSFKYGTSNYLINKVKLYLSRDSEAPSADLQFNIGTAINSGAIAGSDIVITSSQITNTSEGSNFTAYEIAFASPVGPLDAGVTYYLNFESNSANGKKYYLEYTGGNTYPNGTYYKSGSNDGKDIRFQVFGTDINTPDIKAPSIPSGVVASAITHNSATLSWTASTDNVGVTGYEIFQGTNRIGSSATTSFDITGLTELTSYSFTVRAKDAAGNISASSNVVNITTIPSPDIQPPSAPSSLIASNTTTSSTVLSWTASTDNVGVTGYEVFQGATSIGKTATTGFNVTGLSPDTGYSFTVKAKDAAGNVSANSNVVNITTLAPVPDTQAPTIPTNLITSNITQTTVDLSWTASTDNVGVTGYEVFRDATSIGTSATTSFNVTGLTAETNYSFTVKAKDAAGNVSANSTAVTITTLGIPACTGINGYPYSESFETNLGVWTNATGDDIEWTRDSGGTPSTGTGPSTGQDGSFYLYTEASTNVTPAGSPNKTALLNSPCIDLSSVPNGSLEFGYHMQGTAMGSLQVLVSTDNGASYTSLWSQNGSQGNTWNQASVALTAYAGSVIQLQFKATTGSGWSSDIAIDNIKIISVVPDTQAPTVPTNLTASNITNTTADLSWNASADNVGVTEYEIFRGTTSIGTSVTTSFTVTGLTAGTSYSFTVKAKDAAGNVSANSTGVNVTTTNVVQYTLTTNTTGQGSVSGGGVYNSGASVSVVAKPASGWEFAGWTGDLSGNSNPASVTMSSDKTVTARFTETLVISTSTEKYRLTWRGNTSTTMVIGWNQVRGTNPVVHYGSIDFGSNYASYPLSKTVDRTVSSKGMNNQYARLTGLQPDTAYYFVIKDSEGVSKRFWFKTAPNDPNTRLSIIAGGDSRNNRVPRQNANRLVAKIRPHAVLFGGDMTSSSTSSQWQNWFEDWQLTIGADGRIIPVVAARGNHESANDIRDLFDIPTDAGGEFYALSFGGNLIRTYTLNTEVTPAGTQGSWLTNDLAANSANHTWAVAQYHRATRPHEPGKAEQNDQYDAWSKPFYTHAVQLVMESDSHVVKRTWPIIPSTGAGSDQGFVRADNDPNRAVYVGEGCWGAPLRNASDTKSWTRAAGSFNQFKWLWIDKTKIELRTIKVDNAGSVGQVNDNNMFVLPINIDVWNPAGGSVVIINNPHSATTTQRATDIEDSSAKTKLSIYPNPIESGVLHIKYPNYTEAHRSEAVIRDMFGRVIDKVFFTSKTVTYAIDKLNAGVYFVVIKTRKGEVSKKFIKK